MQYLFDKDKGITMIVVISHNWLVNSVLDSREGVCRRQVKLLVTSCLMKFGCAVEIQVVLLTHPLTPVGAHYILISLCSMPAKVCQMKKR